VDYAQRVILVKFDAVDDPAALIIEHSDYHGVDIHAVPRVIGMT